MPVPLYGGESTRHTARCVGYFVHLQGTWGDNGVSMAGVFDKGIRVIRTPIRAPRANATCERFLGSVRRECVDHLLILGEPDLRRVLRAYVAYFNRARPHQGIGQAIPTGAPAVGQQDTATGRVVAFPILGGLHHDYRRVA